MSDALEAAGIVIILFGSSCVVAAMFFVVGKYVADFLIGGEDE